MDKEFELLLADESATRARARYCCVNVANTERAREWLIRQQDFASSARTDRPREVRLSLG